MSLMSISGMFHRDFFHRSSIIVEYDYRGSLGAGDTLTLEMELGYGED